MSGVIGGYGEGESLGPGHRKRIRREIDGTVESSETVEEFDLPSGQVRRRSVRSEKVQTHVSEDVVVEPAGSDRAIIPSRQPVGIDESGTSSNWHQEVPEELKVTVFALDESVPEELEHFAGDYFLRCLVRDVAHVCWEYGFPISRGRYRLCVTGEPVGADRLLLRAFFDGVRTGPAWSGETAVSSVSSLKQVQLQREPGFGSEFNGGREPGRPVDALLSAAWPETITVSGIINSLPQAGVSQGGPQGSSASSGVSSSSFSISSVPEGADSPPPAGSCSSSGGESPPCPPCGCECEEDCCDDGGGGGGGGGGDGKPVPAWRRVGISSAPVRYFDGQVQLTASDIRSDGYGFPWGLSRSYSNQMSFNYDGGNGFNWYTSQSPYLVENPDGTRVAVVRNANSYTWFNYDNSSGAYTPDFGSRSSMVEDISAREISLIDPQGNVTVFNDFATATRPGKFKQFSDAGGTGRDRGSSMLWWSRVGFVLG